MAYLFQSVENRDQAAYQQNNNRNSVKRRAGQMKSSSDVKRVKLENGQYHSIKPAINALEQGFNNLNLGNNNWQPEQVHQFHFPNPQPHPALNDGSPYHTNYDQTQFTFKNPEDIHGISNINLRDDGQIQQSPDSLAPPVLIRSKTLGNQELKPDEVNALLILIATIGALSLSISPNNQQT